MNALIYTRVATDDTANQPYGLEYQETRLLQYCALKKYTVQNIYHEVSSGRTFNRPKWKKIMIFLMENQGLIDKIVFTNWDRFSRNSYEAQGMIKTLEKMKIQVECVEQPLDLSVPDNLILYNIYLAVPEIENKKNSLRIKAAMKHAAMNGIRLGRPPKG